jgi:hypothetical protein
MLPCEAAAGDHDLRTSLNRETTMTTRWRTLAIAAAMLVGVAAAQAAPPTFRIHQVFASPNGYSQFVELVEWAGQDGQDAFRGLTLTASGPRGARTITFGDDLPTTRTAHLSVIVWWTNDALESGYFYGDGGVAHYSGLPSSFVDPDGGTLDFAGVDTFAIPSLPLDGVNAVYRDRIVAPSTLPADCPVAPCPRVRTRRRRRASSSTTTTRSADSCGPRIRGRSRRSSSASSRGGSNRAAT